MRNFVVVGVGLLMSSVGYAAVLDQFAGPYNTSGGGNGTVVLNTSNDTGDWITANSYNNGTATPPPLYYGFDVTVTNNAGETGSGGMFSALQMFTGGLPTMGIGNNWTATAWSWFDEGLTQGDLNSSTPTLPNSYEVIQVGLTKRIVAKITYGNGANDTATVWLNPTTDPEGSQPANLTTSLPLGAYHFSQVNVRTGNPPAAATYSNIIFGTTFADVAQVPEPSGLLLVGAAGAMMLRRRAR